MKKIRLTIFNEPYWDNGLVYTQNILPLIRLSRSSFYKISIVSFTSLPMLFLRRREIKKKKKEMLKYGISIVDYPMLFYPTRFMILKTVFIPFFLINIFFYMKYLAWKDKGDTNIYYSVRSYQTALGFYKFYPYKKNVIFDLRTDWIEENINTGLFKKNSQTVKYWNKIECGMLSKFSKSLFVSPLFMSNVLKRHNLKYDKERFVVVYNPIDYSHFQSVVHDKNSKDFLYTGSLGHWNSLDNYLDFFKTIACYFPFSRFIVCTSSPEYKVKPILSNKKYDDIRNRIQIYYNISYKDLPDYYSKCKFGLQIMDKVDSRVGVKFVEYVASGIIPIVHKNVQGAAQMVEKFGLGITFDNSDYLDAKKLANKIIGCKEIDITSKNYR